MFPDVDPASFNDKDPNPDLRFRDRTMEMRPSYVDKLKRIALKNDIS